MGNTEENIERVDKMVSFMICDEEHKRKRMFIRNRDKIIQFIKEKGEDYYISTWETDSIYTERCLLWVVETKTQDATLKEFF